jgi:hypothetical protein
MFSRQQARMVTTTVSDILTPPFVGLAYAGSQHIPAKVCAVPPLRHKDRHQLLCLGQEDADWLSGNVTHHDRLQTV